MEMPLYTQTRLAAGYATCGDQFPGIRLSGNQQDVLIVLIRQTHRAQEDAKGTRVYIQNEAHKPQKPLQVLERTPGQYWTEPLIDTVTPTVCLSSDHRA